MHAHRLISTFVARRLDTIIPRLSKCKVPRFYLFSVAGWTGLCFTWSGNPKTVYLATFKICCSSPNDSLIDTVITSSEIG